MSDLFSLSGLCRVRADDLFDLQPRVILAMRRLRAMALAADAILEDQRALAFALLGYARQHLRAGHRRLANRHVLAIGHQQHFIDLDLRADILRQALYLHLLADLSPILIACYFEHCVHERPPHLDNNSRPELLAAQAPRLYRFNSFCQETVISYV